jgi:hypothetical protein
MATKNEVVTQIPTKKLAEEIADRFRRFGCKHVVVKKEPNGKWQVKAYTKGIRA